LASISFQDKQSLLEDEVEVEIEVEVEVEFETKIDYKDVIQTLAQFNRDLWMVV